MAVAPRVRWHGATDLLDQLPRLFVHADHRPAGIVGLTVKVQDILHGRNERRILLRRNAPAAAQMRLQRVFLSGLAYGRWRVEIWDTVSGKIVGIWLASADGGELALKVPKIETDFALKLSP